jgi:hypothetical protein
MSSVYCIYIQQNFFKNSFKSFLTHACTPLGDEDEVFSLSLWESTDVGKIKAYRPDVKESFTGPDQNGWSAGPVTTLIGQSVTG